ncbi:hypothetical protein BDEG_25110 [Batrachochytrium dendrobatidis JEL423]|uniref:poly(ADP-ribose) glycohydrolase n=1 Tax=Batrachochytrium dendrobatidis (strain JEL423) TaxID=403673 RepID=A0A177WQA2_BATDL|nr:hypothetical protein BDEG_25110 [Batrachochytrium dendrobatidis JEL423]
MDSYKGKAPLQQKQYIQRKLTDMWTVKNQSGGPTSQTGNHSTNNTTLATSAISHDSNVIMDVSNETSDSSDDSHTKVDDYSNKINLSTNDAVILPIIVAPNQLPAHASQTVFHFAKIYNYHRLSRQLDLTAKLAVAPRLDLLIDIIAANSPPLFGHNVLQEFLLKQNSNYLLKVVPFIAWLALELPTLFPHGLSKLPSGINRCITLTQLQVASLLACAFLCLFDNHQRKVNYPNINFYRIYNSQASEYCPKIQFIFHYFERVMLKKEKETLDGKITFHRSVVSKCNMPDWPAHTFTTLRKLELQFDRIEDIHGTSQADFANKYIGGGVLSSGAVQEEILFLIMPELIASCIITECLQSNETLYMIGIERYSNYSGYAQTLGWAGPHIDAVARDEHGRRKREFVAMDALKFNYRNSEFEYSQRAVSRELGKAYIAFQGSPVSTIPTSSAISTGNWGCGAFNGSLELKSLIQVMAASVASRDIIYLPFNKTEFAQDLIQILTELRLNNVSVAYLFNMISNFHRDAFSKRKSTSWSLFTYIRKALERKQLSNQF